MHRLDAHLALPHALEPARLLLLLLRASTRALAGRAGAGTGALPAAGLLESEAESLLGVLLLCGAGKGLAGLRGKGALAEHGPGGAEDGACRGHAGGG